MTLKKIVVAFALVDFVALNLYVLAYSGLAGLQAAIAHGNPWHLLVAVDLVIALAMVGAWIYRDARARGVSPTPYLALIALSGSIGSLLYLLRRGELAADSTHAASHGRLSGAV